MKIKVLAFNILEGFYPKKDEKYLHDQKREKLAKEIIKKENPDIFIITEANFINKSPGKPFQDYKKIFGYKYGIFGSDWDWGVGILSKYPIIESFDYTTKHSRFVRAIISVNGKKVMVDGVHPDPSHNEHQRMQWFKTVVRDRKDPYIIAGDFNAFSTQDRYNKRNLIRGFEANLRPEAKNSAKSIVSEILTGKAIGLLLKNNLIDTFKAKNKKWDYSYHTPLSKNKWDYSRLDYIFCSEEFKVIKSGIIKNNLTNKASDHYPIYAILEI